MILFSVFTKSLPKDLTTINISNIIGGNTPSYIFAGIIKTSSLMGDHNHSCTRFERCAVREFDLTLDGSSVSGFPLISQDESPIQIFHNFLKKTNRFYDNKCQDQLLMSDFKTVNYNSSFKFLFL